MGGLRRIADGLYVLAVRTSSGQRREPARAQLRQAVRTALAELLSVPQEQITIHATPGSAPHIDAAGRKVACSFSHEDGLSLAAWNLHGPVGVDLMQVQAIPDWETVARDYLGPEACAMLRASPAQDRPRALAQAWTAHEAALKCLGLPLTEWFASASPPALSRIELPVPPHLVATLAF